MYCIHCRKSTPNILGSERIVPAKGNRHRKAAVCSSCQGQKSQFVGNGRQNNTHITSHKGSRRGGAIGPTHPLVLGVTGIANGQRMAEKHKDFFKTIGGLGMTKRELGGMVAPMRMIQSMKRMMKKRKGSGFNPRKAGLPTFGF